MSTTLRFVLLGDDRAGSAFSRFADQVDKSNKSVATSQAALARNETTMRQLASQADKASVSVGRSSASFRAQSKAAEQAHGSMGKLVGTVSGFSSVTQIASKDSSMLAKGLGAVSLATGVAEPLMAGLLVVAGGVAAAFVSAGAGLAAYGIALKPLLTQTGLVTTAQKKLDAARTAGQIGFAKAIAGGASQQTAATARTQAMTAAQQQYNAAIKGTPPSVVAFAKTLKTTQDAYKKWAYSLATPVLAPLRAGLKLVNPLLHDITPLVKDAAMALGYLVGKLSAKITGGGFARVVAEIRPHVIPAIIDLGTSIGNVIAGIWGIIRAFLPVSDQITGRVAGLTKSFKDWASSLPSHSGFKSLMAIFRGETPLVTGLLKNLVIIIKNVAAATTGLASPSNSKALLQILIPLSQIMVRLTAKQGLVRAVLYFTLLRSSLKQLSGAFTGVKTGVSLFTGTFASMQKAYGVTGRLIGGFRNAAVAESEFSGAAGTIGGKLSTVVSSIGTVVASTYKSVAAWVASTASMVANRVAAAAVVVWQKLVTAGQWLLNAAMDANPIGLVVAGLTLLVAGLILAYQHFSGFRMVVQAVWGWIKDHWPLLTAILLGPFGIAVLFIVRHWGQITAAAADTAKAIRGGWSAMIGAIRTAIANVAGFIAARWSDISQAGSAAFSAVRGAGQTAARLVRSAISTLWSVISGVFSNIVHGAANAFGWVPGLGGKLQQAARAFDTWRNNVNAAIKGVQGKTVNVGVKWGIANKGPPGFATGGQIHGPGTGTSDTAGLFRLSNKEWVIRANAATSYGPQAMKAVNDGRAQITYPGMAAGGPVGGNIAVHPVLPSIAAVTTSIDKAVYNLAKVFAKSQGMGSGSGASIASYAAKFGTGQGHPYVWGGTTPSGWDCSGFSGYVYRHFGYSPPRTSQQQQLWAKGAPEQPGALVFFYGRGGAASHVGIALGRGRYVGADSPSVGTIIGSDAGNTGFGIPPGGFKGSRSTGAGGAGGGSTGPAAARELGRALAADRGWRGAQWTALNKLWTRESGWDSKIRNPKSGAAGIPQDISGNMHGGTRGQIIWGLNYIAGRADERTPIGAWAHENAFGWYAKGTGQQGARKGWAVVGERGRELVRFHGGEDVISSPATNAILGGMNGYAKGTNPQRDKWLVQLAALIKELNGDQRRSLSFRKSQRRFIDIEQLWMLDHPGAGGAAKGPHLRALAGLQRQLHAHNIRESATERVLTEKITLLRRLTGYPVDTKYGGPGKTGGGAGGGSGAGSGSSGGGSSGGGSTPAPTFPAPAWLLPYIGGSAAGGMPTALAGLFGAGGGGQRIPSMDPIGSVGPRASQWGGQAGAQPSGGGGWAELIDATHQMRRELAAAISQVAPGTTRGLGQTLNKNVAGVAGRWV